MTSIDYRPLHRRALEVAAGYVAGIDGDSLGRPTPCAGWDLGTLLAHAVGQHYGFAAAVTDGDAPREAYAHRPVAPARVAADWQDSADRLTDAENVPDALGRAPVRRLVIAGGRLVARDGEVVG